MVKQYPHKMTLSTTEDSEYEGGVLVPGDSDSVDLDCRAEPNSKNLFITGPDGQSLVYDWTVYIPLPVEKIAEGTAVELFDENNAAFGRGTVKRFHPGQLNARVWI